MIPPDEPTVQPQRAAPASVNAHVIVFDLGKVLVDFDYSIALRAIAARATQPLESLEHLLLRTPLLLQYESGQLDTAEFFESMREASGFRGDLAEFGRCFGDIFSPIEPMIQLQGELANKGVPTYILSNTNELAVRHIQRAFPFFSRFTGYILSYEHAAMKPDPRLYEALERVSGKAGEEIVYLDDRFENVQAGNARGWHCILHETPEKSRAALRAFRLLS